jgi:hypothetical protein
MVYDSNALRMNTTDFMNRHQAYVDNQYAEYVKEKNAYQDYLDKKTRAEASAEVESQRHQADSGVLTGLLSGAGIGASLGSIVPGWGTAIGAGIGGLAGLAMGLTNKGSANSQADAAERKIATEPLGSVVAPEITGNGLMNPQAWAAASGLAGVIGKVGSGFNSGPEKALTQASQTLTSPDSPSVPQDPNLARSNGLDNMPSGGPTPIAPPQVAGPMSPMTLPVSTYNPFLDMLAKKRQ